MSHSPHLFIAPDYLFPNRRSPFPVFLCKLHSFCNVSFGQQRLLKSPSTQDPHLLEGPLDSSGMWLPWQLVMSKIVSKAQKQVHTTTTAPWGRARRALVMNSCNSVAILDDDRLGCSRISRRKTHLYPANNVLKSFFQLKFVPTPCRKHFRTSWHRFGCCGGCRTKLLHDAIDCGLGHAHFLRYGTIGQAFSKTIKYRLPLHLLLVFADCRVFRELRRH